MPLTPIAQWSWPSRNRGRTRPVSTPPVKENPVAGPGHHVTPSLAGGPGAGGDLQLGAPTRFAQVTSLATGDPEKVKNANPRDRHY